MILKNELRIGNWTLDAKGNFFKISLGAEIDKSDTLSPVPLSSVILKNCGFAYDNYFKLWQNLKKIKPPQMELDIDYNVKDFGHRFIGVQLKSLHQLQNLFYQLKGAELETAQMINQKQMQVA